MFLAFLSILVPALTILAVAFELTLTFLALLGQLLLSQLPYCVT